MNYAADLTKPGIYRGFGLVIDSEFPCPDLPEGDGAACDVTIRFGMCPESLGGDATKIGLFQVRGREFLLKLDSVAKYHVRNGNEITIDRAAGATDEDVRIFLFGSCVGALLHQRGVFPLHASAVAATDGTCAAFSGASGMGKSTMAGAMVKRGYTMLADDIAPIDLSSGKPKVVPGVPFLKLWEDSAISLGQEMARQAKVRQELEKYYVPIAGRFASTPVPLKAIFILNEVTSDKVTISPLKGQAKLKAIMNNTYRAKLVQAMGTHKDHFAQCMGIASGIEVFNVDRPMELSTLDELADLVERELKG